MQRRCFLSVEASRQIPSFSFPHLPLLFLFLFFGSFSFSPAALPVFPPPAAFLFADPEYSSCYTGSLLDRSTLLDIPQDNRGSSAWKPSVGVCWTPGSNRITFCCAANLGWNRVPLYPAEFRDLAVRPSGERKGSTMSRSLRIGEKKKRARGFPVWIYEFGSTEIPWNACFDGECLALPCTSVRRTKGKRFTTSKWKFIGQSFHHACRWAPENCRPRFLPPDELLPRNFDKPRNFLPPRDPIDNPAAAEGQAAGGRDVGGQIDIRKLEFSDRSWENDHQLPWISVLPTDPFPLPSLSPTGFRRGNHGNGIWNSSSR